jgi:large repetitive protein
MWARRRGVFVCSVLCVLLAAALSASTAFSASNPVPYVDILSPVSVHPGSTSVTLTLNGTGFVSTSVVEWNGTALTTTFVSAKQLTAAVPDSLVAAVGLGSITVVNPTPGGRVSNVVYFPVASFETTTVFPSTPNSSLAVGTTPQGIITADFNGDGKLDLAVANSGSNTVSILLGNGDGTFTTKSTPAAGSGSNWLVAGDFNEDGILDLAVANLNANTVSILLGNGDGTFTLKSSPATGSHPLAITVGDFNGDGHLDLAVSNSGAATVTVLLGDGTGLFTTSSTPTVGSDPQVIVAGDFNEDGILDLAVSNESSNTVSVLLGIGNGTFQSQATISVGGSGLPIGLIAADLEGSHHLDLAALNASDVAILRGNGLGSFTLIGNPTTGTNDLIAAVAGDYNGDGKLDLVVSDRTAGKAFLLPGNGNGTFGTKLTFTTAAGSFGVATADFNGDGGLDLAVANGNAANVSIFLQDLPVSLFPTSVAFGSQNLNTSSGPHIVTLKNSSGASLTIATVDITGADNASFSDTSTCGATLANGATCTASVTFTPTTSGALSATLTFTDTASNSPQTLALTGTGFTAAPSFTSASTVILTVGTSGSFSVTATATPTASLAESGTLPSGVTFVDNGNGTGTLSGTPGVGSGGTYPVTFTATNSAGSTPQTFSLIVDQAAAITSTNSASFSVASAGSFVISATGNPTPSFSEIGALPNGVTFIDNNNSTATLAGTPAGGTAGTYNVTITAHNGVGSNATQSFTLTVNQTSSFTGANNATFTVGSAGTFTVTASGSPTPTLSESGTLPSGVAFNPATGVLSGTPAPGTGGAYPISFTASNGVGSNATLNFMLAIDQVSAISSGNSTTFTTGTTGTFAVTATGFPAPTLSESGMLPSGVTFNAGTGVLSGTPAAGTGGSYSLTFTAHNGVGSNASQTFSFSVNQPASITSPNHATFAAASSGTVTVTVAGFPVPALSESGALPSGVTFNAGTGVLSGTPAAGTGGSYPITFTGHNGVGADATQAFTLSVNQTSSITSAASATFAAGAAGSFTVTATGSPAPTVSESGALPAGVTFNTGTSVLSGTPAAGAGGNYPITLTASNGVGSNATQSFLLTVSQTSSFTSANNATFTVGSVGTFTVGASGSPAPTFSETGTLPSGVTFNPVTGVLTGTPAAGTGASYPITITASNGVGSNATLNFTLTVDQSAAITSANNTIFTAGGAGTFTVVSTGFPVPALSELGTLPSGIAFDTATGILHGTAVAGTGGTYPITFIASNGVGSNATQSFTITVNQSSSISSANHATFTAGSAGTFTVTATGSPASVFSENGALPAGVTFNPATGALGGIPAAGTGGTYPISFTASNGIGSSSTLGFTLTVNQAAAITSPNTTSFAFGAASTFNVTTTGQPAPSLTETGALPVGISFVDSGNGTAVFAGTPGVGAGGTYNLTLTAHNGIGSNATVSFTLTVAKGTPTLTWNSPSAIGFGSALTAAQLDATSSVPGTFVYSPAAGTILAAGSQSLSVTFTPTDAADYTSTTASAILAVNKATPSLTWVPPSPVTYGTALSSAQLDASSVVAGTWTYTPPAGTVLNAGSQSLSVSFTPSSAADYQPATAQVLLVVNPAATTTTISISPSPADGSASVTLTASIVSAAGVPSGSVTFFDSSTPLGTIVLTAGGATFTTSTLTSGNHSIRATYSGSANFTTSTSAALPETVVRADFDVASAASLPVIQAGQPLSVPITVTPEGGFTGQVQFALSGLPVGATAVFSPAILTLSASPAKETLTITTTPRFPYLSRTIPESPGVFAGVLWLPLAGLLAGGAGVVRRNRKFWVSLALIAISSVVLVVGGCASAGNFQNAGTAAGTYNLVITASSASTTHTTTVILHVQ